MPNLAIKLLGPFEALLDGRRIEGFDSDKVRGLLAYLAVETDRPHRREKLAGLLWPDYPEQSARTSLRRALANLKSLIEDKSATSPYLSISRESIQFIPGSTSLLDAAEFLHLIERTGDESSETEALERAARLYRGPFLEGFSLADCQLYEEWVIATRGRLQEKMLQVLMRLSSKYESRGKYPQAVAHARMTVSLDSYQEQARRQLMRLLALSGHRNEALEQYRIFEALLQTDLGVPPEAETAALYSQIQAGDLKPGEDQGIPSGTVTFLFCDIEDSTQLLRGLGKDYTELLSGYREHIERVLVRWDGAEIDRQGDALFCSFPRAIDAVNAAVDVQRMLAEVEWPHGTKVSVRMGLHAGEPWIIEEGYVGLDVHRAARIGAMGSGGQVLLSLAVSELVKDSLPAGVSLINLGYYLLKDFDRPESISQLSISGLPSEFPPLKGKQSSPPQVWQQEAARALPGFLEGRTEAEAEDPAPRVSFVAREAELEKLHGLLQQVLKGQGTTAFVTGGPGRGKTALMAEFARRAMLEHPDLLVISGSCSAYTGIGDPYLPFRDALGMLLGDVEERWRSGSISREHAIRLWQALPLVLDAVLDS
ncbi:MAG TPA: BTAD domain-containing putative transcriptional regulator, partial [Anaerolineales bacterium]|nr:BTAD domain-containing putative transcriptional regulator [Anaerolineales bacterium]